eukprot:c17778_g1_i1 orf=398-1918(-)
MGERSVGDYGKRGVWMDGDRGHEVHSVEVLGCRIGMLAMDLWERLKVRRRNRRVWKRRGFFVLSLSLVFVFITAFQWTLSISPPIPKLLPSVLSCRDAPEGYVLHQTGICTDTCGKLCFPRLRGVCFGPSQVTVCDYQPPVSEEIKNAWGGVPSEMRFYKDKPRAKVPVRHGACPGWNSSATKPIEGKLGDEVHWIRGLQMVADLTLMPTGKVGPNPHHEAEKVVPAILFSHLYHLGNSTLHWFADPTDPLMISKWSLGLLEVFSDDMKVQFLPPVAANQPPICFEDAILFTGVTNSGYMPNADVHNWFRNRILEHCEVPISEASRPVENVVIVHRPNSSRNIANYEAVKDVLEKELRVPVKMAVPGPWDFCTQVRLVAQADVLLTPHGSQNANLLVVRPGAVVIEIFPLLYYIDWYGHYLHAGRVSHYELYGTWPFEEGNMPLLMRVYALLYGWQKCFVVRHCMNYGKSQKIYTDLKQLKSLLHALIRTCRIVVQGSGCLHKSSN